MHLRQTLQSATAAGTAIANAIANKKNGPAATGPFENTTEETNDV
jgi:hypothetical protein